MTWICCYKFQTLTIWLVVWNIFLIFPFHIWDVILPIDELIFFRGVGIPPSSYNPANSLAKQTTNNICFCRISKSWPICSDADTSLGGDGLAAPGPQLRSLPSSDAFRSSKIWGPPTWFGAPRTSTVTFHLSLPPTVTTSLWGHWNNRWIWSGIRLVLSPGWRIIHFFPWIDDLIGGFKHEFYFPQYMG